ncbi:SET domain-containing protein [Candidatus Aenigmatarchaeota archaeon]
MSKLKSYRSPKVEVKESLLGNKGIFAKEDIKKGEIVFIKNGHIVNFEEAKRYNENLGDLYALQINDDFFLTPTNEEEVENTVIFVNHSCNPNLGPEGQITFVALRDIKSGEELCYDYSTCHTHEFQFECRCGSKSCRKMITGNDWKIKKLQDNYGNNFSSYIIRKIKS